MQMKLCECGCGREVTKEGNRFINGHNFRGKSHSPEATAKMSANKLGVPHTSPAQIAADEANAERQRGVPLPPETCANMSEAGLGVSNSPEHNAAISAGRKNSDAVKAEDDKMRGGNDLVWHHWLYDHNDLSLNTVQMTRSNHTRLHHSLKRLGCIIPHINSPDEPTKEPREEDV